MSSDTKQPISKLYYPRSPGNNTDEKENPNKPQTLFSYINFNYSKSDSIDSELPLDNILAYLKFSKFDLISSDIYDNQNFNEDFYSQLEQIRINFTPTDINDLPKLIKFDEPNYIKSTEGFDYLLTESEALKFRKNIELPNPERAKIRKKTLQRSVKFFKSMNKEE